MTMKCEYCDRSFKRSTSLETHMCKEKQRMLAIDEKNNVLAYSLYNSWQKQAMFKKTDTTYESFSKSAYFMTFVKFAKFILDNNISDSDEYMKWLIINKVKSAFWNKQSMYSKFQTSQQEKETPERALEKYIILADSWAKENGEHWCDFWQKANRNLIVHYILLGKISPWILFCAESAVKFMNELPEETLANIAARVNIDFWNTRIKSYRKEVELIKEVIK
jgi:hypothetical protein